MKTLENKVAVVTGGGSGIGRSICLLYAAEGARVVVSDINEQVGQETASQITSAGGEAVFVRADTSSPEDNRSLVDQAVSRFGALHVAVNNAGIGGPLSPTGEYPVDGWDRVIAINLSGVFYGMRYQIPAMLESGGGSVVNVASILGSVGTRLSPARGSRRSGGSGCHTPDDPGAWSGYRPAPRRGALFPGFRSGNSVPHSCCCCLMG